MEFQGVSVEDAFIAGVLSGVVLGCEGRDSLEGVDSAQERVRALTQELLLGGSKEALLESARSALGQLRSDLGCSICWETIQSPVSLQCGHNFCRPCVSLWIKSRPSCPVCREPTLSYRSYSENVALRELARRLGPRKICQGNAGDGSCCDEDDDEEMRRELVERLAALEAEDAAAMALETDADRRSRSLLNEINLLGRVREQGLQRPPYQRDIRVSLRERERLSAHREATRRLFDNHILREFYQRSGTQDPQRLQLLEQLTNQMSGLRTSNMSDDIGGGINNNGNNENNVLNRDQTALSTMSNHRMRLADEIRSFTASRNFQTFRPLPSTLNYSSYDSSSPQVETAASSWSQHRRLLRELERH